MEKIAILLATYNGEQYLAQQIDSLLSQTYKGWNLYIHDDGSTDNTASIIHSYCDKYDNLTALDYPPTGGAKNNFLSLLQRIDADYYMFCDQDDVWDEKKIEIEINRMHEMESTYGDIPLLVFSDLRVVDNTLNEISPSMWRDGGVNPEYLCSFDKGAVFEFVTGCTMLFNDKAKRCVSLNATHALMHDSWIACCILKANGIINGVNKPLVNYRQHGDNTLGATNWASHGTLYKLSHISTIIMKNYRHWKSLEDLGYGSFFKYLKNKYLFRKRHHGKE
ncbi:MAG: glycosyltransferase family 2 protein [Prevotella sp.]|nr:glycosyltransferase family 2 protein [Prevotella sp.]MDY2703342.1 glycosyltransferase family 2 protein [Prevotella sp.]